MKDTVGIILCFGLLLGVPAAGSAQTKTMDISTHHTETATLGGGCFWCTEAIFQMLPGVKSVTSGYAGGTTENPTYKQVCSGKTGHAEVIQIEFDPKVVSYEKVLETFWEAHDPTTLNRQGDDAGTQYRSIILYQDEAQRLAAEKSKAEAQKRLAKPIVTEIVPLKHFYKAEALSPGLLPQQPEPAVLPGGHPAQGGQDGAETESAALTKPRITQLILPRLTNRTAVRCRTAVLQYFPPEELPKFPS